MTTSVSPGLPTPRLTKVYRLEATLGDPLDLGERPHGRRRIVALTGGKSSGPELKGRLLAGSSADWQSRPAGRDCPWRHPLHARERRRRPDARPVPRIRHGSAEVLGRLARGMDADANEYVFRAATQIETAAPHLDRLNRGIFVSVGGRHASAVIYETYIVE